MIAGGPRRRAVLGWMVRTLAGLGLLLVLVSATPFTGWYAKKLAGHWSGQQGEVLIVLGGGTVTADMIALDSFWRAVYAVRIYREGEFRQVLLSGAGVASLMRDFLIYEGVPPECIRLEVTSRSTRENAIYIQSMLAVTPGRKVLLTSDYHMWRASRVFRKLGMDVLPLPIPDAYKRYGHWESRWSAFVDEGIETAKIVYYFARGWI